MYALSASTVALHLRMSRLSTTTYEKQQVTGSSLLPTPAACAKLLVLLQYPIAWHTQPGPVVC